MLVYPVILVISALIIPLLRKVLVKLPVVICSIPLTLIRFTQLAKVFTRLALFAAPKSAHNKLLHP